MKRGTEGGADKEQNRPRGGSFTIERSAGISAARPPSGGRPSWPTGLAPLELDCMNMLWPLGESTVREIRDRLAERRPRAYTTIMTIMDRLARKGIVERRKSGRAYVYSPNLSAEQARSQAVRHLIANFFGGSREALAKHLQHDGAAAAPAADSAAPRPEIAAPEQP